MVRATSYLAPKKPFFSPFPCWTTAHLRHHQRHRDSGPDLLLGSFFGFGVLKRRKLVFPLTTESILSDRV